MHTWDIIYTNTFLRFTKVAETFASSPHEPSATLFLVILTCKDVTRATQTRKGAGKKAENQRQEQRLHDAQEACMQAHSVLVSDTVIQNQSSCSDGEALAVQAEGVAENDSIGKASQQVLAKERDEAIAQVEQEREVLEMLKQQLEALRKEGESKDHQLEVQQRDMEKIMLDFEVQRQVFEAMRAQLEEALSCAKQEIEDLKVQLAKGPHHGKVSLGHICFGISLLVSRCASALKCSFRHWRVSATTVILVLPNSEKRVAASKMWQPTAQPPHLPSIGSSAATLKLSSESSLRLWMLKRTQFRALKNTWMEP
jgi:hypothetical protein